MKALALLLCVMAAGVALADEQRSIPVADSVIVLQANARPVEVPATSVQRYRCAAGHMVASSESQAARTSTRLVTLRCITG